MALKKSLLSLSFSLLGQQSLMLIPVFYQRCFQLHMGLHSPSFLLPLEIQVMHPSALTEVIFGPP